MDDATACDEPALLAMGERLLAAAGALTSERLVPWGDGLISPNWDSDERAALFDRCRVVAAALCMGFERKRGPFALVLHLRMPKDHRGLHQ